MRWGAPARLCPLSPGCQAAESSEPVPLVPPSGLRRCSCSQRQRPGERGRRCPREATLQLRRPGASSAAGVLQPHAAASETNLLHPQNWLQRGRSKDTRPLSKPPVCPSRPSSFISRPPGVTPPPPPLLLDDRGPSYPSPVPTTPDQMPQAGPPGSSPPHGPNERTGQAACSALDSRRASGAPLALRGKGRSCPFTRRPLVSTYTLPLPVDSCRPLQIPRV